MTNFNTELSREDCDEAIIDFLILGWTPTAADIQNALGRGSLDLISLYLSEWKLDASDQDSLTSLH